jgi:hypothetical protein
MNAFWEKCHFFRVNGCRYIGPETNQASSQRTKETAVKFNRPFAFSLALALAYIVSTAPTAWALDVPDRDRVNIFVEPKSFASRIFSDFIPAWKQKLIPLEIPELKQPSLILPETLRTPTLAQRWYRDLLRLPFRPIRIGRTPRLPNDPETGLGLVFRLPVSF